MHQAFSVRCHNRGPLFCICGPKTRQSYATLAGFCRARWRNMEGWQSNSRIEQRNVRSKCVQRRARRKTLSQSRLDFIRPSIVYGTSITTAKGQSLTSTTTSPEIESLTLTGEWSLSVKFEPCSGTEWLGQHWRRSGNLAPCIYFSRKKSTCACPKVTAFFWGSYGGTLRPKLSHGMECQTLLGYTCDSKGCAEGHYHELGWQTVRHR